MRFEPSGFTNNEQIPIAKSIMDYIFRYLSIKFLNRDPDREGDPAAAPVGGTSGTPKPAAADLDVSRSGPSSDVSTDASPAADIRQGELDFGEMGSPGNGARDDLIGRTVESFMETTSGSTPDRGSSGRPSRFNPTAFQNPSDAPPCPECGSITIRSGACYQCPNCGTSTGCG
jgi:ribonucleoside-diphosphate reductase alpha chain